MEGEIAWQVGTAPVEELDECNLFYENRDIEDVYQKWEDLVKGEEELQKYKAILEDAVKMIEAGGEEGAKMTYNKVVVPILHRHKTLTRKAVLLSAYQTLVAEKQLARCVQLEHLLVTKRSKSASGVLVITVLTSPYPTVNGKSQKFSCKWNCYYCPNQPGQPRSYLRDEPAVRRANQNGFDPVLQFTDRARVLAQNGHPVDKVELLVLGGTWSSYPVEYQEVFVRDLFYAANTFMCRERRPKWSLFEEQRENETAFCKIIGLTLETRPDTIDLDEITRFRRYGCTRVQIGLQHTDNRILEKINRQCTNEDAIRAIRILKDNCFKIDIHIMLNLPGSSPSCDIAMVEQIIADPDLQCDQWKLYPCEVTPWTVIERWHKEGKFTPYSEEELVRVLIESKAKIPPWIRLNRVVRDIPKQYIVAGMDTPNLRQDLTGVMKSKGLKCRCIRCREVGLNNKVLQGATNDVAVLKHRIYPGSGGMEYFISFETEDEDTIFGFIRLRLPPKDAAKDEVMTDLRGAALIRELHVYGQLIPTKTHEHDEKIHSQHVGFGRRLLEEAERIAFQAGYRKMAVIAGVGTRHYYRKLGYVFQQETLGRFSVKELNDPHHKQRMRLLTLVSCSTVIAATVSYYFRRN